MNEYGIKSTQTAQIGGKSNNISRFRFSVAPMMEWTNRHCRFFHRLLTRRALLYTEMITAGAVLHGDRARLRIEVPAHQIGIAERRREEQVAAGAA